MNKAKDLVDYMVFVSLKKFGEPWAGGLEYFLWHCCLNGFGIEGMDIDVLEKLARRHDGWFVWDEELQDAKFVEMAEWILIYQEEMGENNEKNEYFP